MIKIFEELFGNILSDKDLDISITFENSELTTYCENSKRITDEKYILEINKNKITITCSCEKGAFYALCDIAKK